MKCLLCSSVFKNQQELLDHYISYHNVDEKNCFFQKKFQSDNRAFLKNCLRCDQFLTTKKEKAIHRFLKHYNEGKDIPFEEKPLDVVRYPSLLIYQIEYKKYSHRYSFYNSDKCVDEFLQNVKYRFHATSKKWFKCSFITKNTQNSIRPDLQSLLNTRYCTTETYDNMTGSSWYFKW